MTIFEILMFTLGFIGIIAGIITAFVKNKIAIAEINVEILNIKHELLQKELAITKLEQRNTFEHDKILDKIDKMINTINK
jgi:hypothetical protein